MLSEPGEIVMDPFSGRGTTLLEARLLGRLPIASDLNPIAYALTRAKNTSVHRSDVMERIWDLQAKFDPALYRPEAAVQGDNIRLIYHPHTLAQLCFLRRHLLSSNDPVDHFLIGAVLGTMHGSERMNGSSAYLSISMPNTFSMSPGYVQRFVETKRLDRVARNVFDVLENKINRLFRGDEDLGPSGLVAAANVRSLAEDERLTDYIGRVRLIVASPPYLDIVNYGKQNWIRNWFVDERDDYGSIDELDDELTLREWLSFAEESVLQMKKMLQSDGVIAMVVGDVVRTGGAISLAREFIRRVVHHNLFDYIGCLSDHIQSDIKTTRIWKDTKGQATNIDRIIFFSNSRPTFHYRRLATALFRDHSIDVSPITATRLQQHAREFTQQKPATGRKRDIHVIPYKDGWARLKEGSSRPGSVHSTQREAIAKGRNQALRDKVELVIHRKDGTIRDSE